MRNIWLVIRHEVVTTLKRPSFWIMTFLMPVLLLGLQLYGAIQDSDLDLGGADGLVHLSELSWRRVRHPREVLRAGQEVDVYVLRLDKERKRIGLSLKRCQPDPWSHVADDYKIDELVETVDILPTILDILGLNQSLDIDGESLVPMIEGGKRKKDYAIMQTRPNKNGDFAVGIRTDEWKFISMIPSEFDLEEDIEDLKVISKLDLQMNPVGGETRFKKFSQE